MNEYFNELRRSYQSALTNTCNKGGCRLGLDSLPAKPIIIDADLYRDITDCTGKICDYFIFSNARAIILAVVEMTAGKLDSSVTVQQIQAGAREGEKMLGHEQCSDFYPIALCGRVGSSVEFKVLRKRKIAFRGRQYLVIIKRCGAQLSEIMGA